MKKLSLLTALLLSTVAGFAQMYNINGHITDNNNNPVAGQVVEATAWSQWTLYDTTDANGDYQIDIPNTTTINSFIDIKTYGSSCSTWYTDSTLYNNQQNYTADFVLCPNTTFNYFVSGQVTTGTSGADAAIVYLIEQVIDSNQNTILTAIDSVLADTQSGYYTMQLPTSTNGVLKVKAALLSYSSNYAGYLPTYFNSSLTWNGTGVQTVPVGSNTTANIALIAGTNLGGPAFIGGDVTQGANKNTAVGDPLAGRILILTDAANNAKAYTYSDANGNFSFPSLAYGSYKLFGDAPGKSNPALSFTLDANHPSLSDINFHENDDTFWGKLWATSVASTPELNNVSVYPNPATDVLNVNGLDAVEGTKTITISSINGAVVFNGTFAQGQKVAISVTNQNSGMYMMNISTEKGNSIYKIVK